MAKGTREQTKALQRVTLEMSLKPFQRLETDAIEAVCAEALRQWLPLIGMADTASVLLWIADGSEILVWDGDLDQELEWAKYIGFANEQMFHHIEGKDDPKRAIPYTDDPVRMTYRDIGRIVEAFKRVGRDRYGIRVEVGATFDAGPEFAYSDFKYKDHPEINYAELGGEFIALRANYSVVCSWAKLKADRRSYAAYPDGIPDGTPFGTFFGRQCASFLPALGFDYIWFSNGFALSYFPWTYLGANYDGTELSLADYGELSGKVLSFWDLFKETCPGYRVEIRGTNFGTGMDLAKDCIPLRDLYERGYLAYPPPNSPWGALNYDFGLEMVGLMSRIAVLPGDGYPYRFYPNDPWFWQNPWWDLYDREPHDIYCPLSISRLNEQGETEGPKLVELLTIDTERGELNEDCAMEVIPHIRKALRDFPDRPGPLTWVYPFDELHDAMASSPAHASGVFFHDWFIRNAINEGLPLNTVVGTGIFKELLARKPETFRDTIVIVSAQWVAGENAGLVAEFVRSGGRVLLYGPVEDEAALELLNLAVADGEGIDGEVELRLDGLRTDDGDMPEASSRRLLHRSIVSAGPLKEVVRDARDPYTQVRAVATQGAARRAFALSRALPGWNGGQVSWVRGSLPYQAAGVTNLPIRQEQRYFDSTVLARYVLQDFGYALLQSKLDEEASSALLFIARKDNGYWLTGCKQDSSVQLQFRFPEGVPVLFGHTTIAGGPEAGGYALSRTFHQECRVFVDQADPSAVACREHSPRPTANKRKLHSLTQRRFAVSRLKQAKVTIYPPLDALSAERVEVLQGDRAVPFQVQRELRRIVLGPVDGTIEVVW